MIVLFCIKVIAGFFYAYYFSNPIRIATADTWVYFNESIIETEKLLNQPKLFFSDIFYNHYKNVDGLFTGTNSFWNDLKTTVFVKLLAVLNVFTLKNYYTLILFFNLFFLFGGIAFYKLIKEHFIINKWLLIVAIFLIPGFLFWGSGVHKDGLIFSCIILSIYYFSNIINGKLKSKQFVYLLISLSTIFLLRNYILLALIPMFFCWFLISKTKIESPVIVFAAATIFCLMLFFFSSYSNKTTGISNSIVQKHNEFKALNGNSKFSTPLLSNAPASLIKFFPYAIQYSFLKPFPSDIKTTTEFFSLIENYFFIFLGLFALFKLKKDSLNSTIILTCLSIAFLILTIIGYTVCFYGALVRYRSIIYPLISVPILLIIFAQPLIKSKAN